MLNSSERYGGLAKVFHWLTALAIVGMFPFAWWMTELKIGPQMFQMYGLHKSVGILVLTVTVFRLGWRLLNPKPRFLGGPTWQRWASEAVHIGLYTCLIALPVIGLLHSNAANFPVSVFGLVTMPQLIVPDRDLVEPLQEAHEIVGIMLLVLLGLHVAGALKHHFFDKDATLRRMLPFAAVTASAAREHDDAD
ncbi:MAG: cytochrome b [Alphaproteobacteria bacterium]|nr:cytochrome b [Alphaproteobacteria bacterium]